MRRIFFFLLLLGGYGVVSGQAVVSVGSLLKEMTSFSSVARWPSPAYTMQQASSYDRRSIAVNQPGWFANGDANQFIRHEEKDGRTEYVMMDAEGPGTVVRFWLTTVVKPGVLRFYLDNEKEASIVVPAYDLLKAGFGLGPGLLNPHSSYEANGKGGNTLYLPIPYQKHCKITFTGADAVSFKQSHYYQINYRTYAAGTRVKTFTTADLRTYRAGIDSAESLLWHPPASVTGRRISHAGAVAAADSFSFALPAGSSAVRELSIRVNTSGDRAVALRSVILKMEFDGEQTVWCPVGDFSGSGYGGKPIHSWYRSLEEDGRIVCRWVMPYQRSARVTVINLASFGVSVSVDALVDRFRWDSRSLYFHATYKYSENIWDAKWDYDVKKVASSSSDPLAPIEWNFITVKGRGIYLGNTLAVNNHMNSWYGEGDAKVWVDGDRFPSEFGTGLEDYYNTSWAPVVLYQTPFANAPRADNASSFGHNTFTRTRNLDGVPFRSFFRYDLEMLSWDGGRIDAAATVYWYGGAGARVVR